MLRRACPRFASLGVNACRYASSYTLPDLPYDYSDLEPYISGEIMQLHHSKHHATYVKNLNAALEQRDEADQRKDIEAVIALNSAIQFNGGGPHTYSF